MGKVVIITGASGNLGKAVVEKLIGEGYTVVVTVMPNTSLGHHEDHPQVDIHTLDLLDEPAAEGFIHVVTKKYGSIQAALLLVGGYASGSIRDTNNSALKKMYALNFETAYNLARPVFNQMVSQAGGRIIFVGARPALNPAEGKSNLAYALSKSLIFKLSEYLNAEGAEKNVVSSVIVPSILDTPENRKAMPKADFSTWVDPKEVADTMAFILSEKSAALREPVFKMYGRA